MNWENLLKVYENMGVGGYYPNSPYEEFYHI